MPDEITDPIDLDTDLEPGDTFPREYVEKLRSEAAGHRTKAKEAEGKVETAVAEAVKPLQERIFALQVAATGRLADPTDLPFNPELLDEAALAGAIDALLAAKPHLAKRKVQGDVGQGTGKPEETFSLQGLISGRA